MAKKRRKRSKSRRKKKTSKRHVPIKVLEKRLGKLKRLIKARGGRV